MNESLNQVSFKFNIKQLLTGINGCKFPEGWSCYSVVAKQDRSSVTSLVASTLSLTMVSNEKIGFVGGLYTFFQCSTKQSYTLLNPLFSMGLEECTSG